MSTVPSSRPALGRTRRTSIALVAVLTVLGVASPTVAAQDDPGAVARHGAAWLAAQVDRGLPLENFGAADWGVTLDAALGLAATGTGGPQLGAIWEALVAERDDVAAPFDGDAPGRLARMILLARALGEDPRSVGAAPGEDLVERLEVLRQDDGPDAGLFGTTSPLFDGAFRQGFSLVALSVVGGSVDESSIAWLEQQQCGSGAWMPYRSDLSIECAFDADLFVGPDSNSTAIALAALTVVEPDSDAIDPGLQWLLEQRNADGGWGFYPGDESEPSSTAFALQVLLAQGLPEDLSGPAWTALSSFQLGCDAPEDERGALTFPGSNDAPNLFSTSQALPALAGATLDAPPREIVPGVEPLDCSSVPPTPPSAPGAPGGLEPVPSPVPGNEEPPVGAGVSASGTPAGSSEPGAVGIRGASGERELALTGADRTTLLLAGLALVLAGLVMRAADRRLT